MNKIEDDTELKLNLYDPMQAWILNKDTKSKARKAARHKTGKGNQDDMVYGVNDRKQQQAQTETIAPTSPEVDPWLTSADPWASPPGLAAQSPESQPEATWTAADAAWQADDPNWPPPGGDLDTFGKGKGKNKGKGYEKPPLECHNDHGKGHPFRL